MAIINDNYEQVVGDFGNKVKSLDTQINTIEQQLENHFNNHPGGDSSLVFDYITEEVDYTIPCEDISLNPSSLTFTGSGSKTIQATLTPTSTTDILTWSSDNKSIATVNNGVVTAVSNGSCYISAICGVITKKCSVNVSGISGTVSVTGVTLDKEVASINIGDTITLSANIQPPNATNQGVKWTSDSENIATVVDGLVMGISKGVATICVTTDDKGYSDTCNVTVNEVQTVTYRNLFDKNTMVTANQGITGAGVIGNYTWGLARVPVKENTQYSIKMCSDYDGSAETAKKEWRKYNGSTAGGFGFADGTGNTLISVLSFSHTQSDVDANLNGANALLHNYAHDERVDLGYVGWVTFTTPIGCTYLLFNTTLNKNADQIQLEEGDTIHDYYLPYSEEV